LAQAMCSSRRRGEGDVSLMRRTASISSARSPMLEMTPMVAFIEASCLPQVRLERAQAEIARRDR